MARLSRKEMKQDEFVEGVVDASHWVEKNWQTVAKIAAAVVVVAILGAVGFGWFRAQRAAALEQLGQALARYERVEAAGFADTADLEAALADLRAVSASGAPAQVAQFYVAASLFRLGRTDEAIPVLDDVIASGDAPPSLVATAQALLVEAYSVVGQHAEAIALLNTLVDDETTLFPRERALSALARAHVATGDRDTARELWRQIVDEFPGTDSAREAQRALDS